MSAAEYSGNVIAVAEDLAGLGYDLIPIIPGDKKPICTAWPTTPPAEQWQGVRADGLNLALRHGGDMRLASMEAERERPEAIPALRRFLAGLGYDWQSYPANRTAHGGERYFFALVDAPGGHFRKMHADFGKGELRYGPGAFALIPPSVLADGGRYSMIAGAWDGELPKLLWADVAPLLADGRRPDALPAIAPPKLSALAQAVADGENVLPDDVRKRLRGMGGTDYPSVDDFRTVYRLAGMGWDADSTLALMQANPGFGYFSDLAVKNHAAAVQWLYNAHAKAIAYIAENGTDVSQHLARLIEQAEAQPWPGRTGATDKAVYLAHLRIAADANTPVWAGASRRIADAVNVGAMTATRATRRLIEAGKLVLHTPATAQLAAEYALPTDDSAHSGTLLYVPTKRSVPLCAATEGNEPSGVGVGVGVRDDSGVKLAGTQAIIGHDLFCWQGLGKATALVYVALLEGPSTVAELITKTGRHRETVKRALSRLAGIQNQVAGDVYALVEESEPGTWEIADDDEAHRLDKAARLLGAAGIGEKRRAKHEQERQRHAGALEVYKDGAPIPHPSQNRGARMTKGEIIREARTKSYTERIGTPEAEEFRLQAEAML